MDSEDRAKWSQFKGLEAKPQGNAYEISAGQKPKRPSDFGTLVQVGDSAWRGGLTAGNIAAASRLSGAEKPTEAHACWVIEIQQTCVGARLVRGLFPSTT